jgi:hypothetical protein
MFAWRAMQGSEKRRFVRVRPSGLVSKTGKIIVDPKKPVIDCDVIDLSAGGACLQVRSDAPLPRRFEFLHGGSRKKCLLVWKSGRRVGVSY